MIEALQFDFMQHALMAGLLASIACGIIGTLVVVHRIVFVSGGLAHGAYGGIGLAFAFHLPPFPSIMGFSLAISLLMAGITLKLKERADTIIGVLWAAGMALGIILVDITPGYQVDLMSFLFGSIIAVPLRDIYIMAGIDLFILAIILVYYKEIVAISYDEEFAKIRGVNTTFFHILLYIMIAMSVVMLIRIVGLILVIALMTIPPFLAERYSASSLAGMMFVATILSILFIITGLFISFAWNLTSGASIIMVASIVFFASLALEWSWKSYRRNNNA